MLFSSANKLRQNSNASSREKYIPQILSPSGNERGGKSVFAGWVIEQLRCPFGFILLSFAMNVVMGYQGFQ